MIVSSPERGLPCTVTIHFLGRRLRYLLVVPCSFTWLISVVFEWFDLVAWAFGSSSVIVLSDLPFLFQERPDNWRDHGIHAQQAFAKVASAISRFEAITVCASPSQVSKAVEISIGRCWFVIEAVTGLSKKRIFVWIPFHIPFWVPDIFVLYSVAKCAQNVAGKYQGHWA